LRVISLPHDGPMIWVSIVETLTENLAAKASCTALF
jgi:hypothetical protein